MYSDFNPEISICITNQKEQMPPRLLFLLTRGFEFRAQPMKMIVYFLAHENMKKVAHNSLLDAFWAAFLEQPI